MLFRSSPELKTTNIPDPHNWESFLVFIETLISSENVDYIIKQIQETDQFIHLSFWRKKFYYTYIINKETGSFYSFNSIDEFFGPFTKYVNNEFIIGSHQPELNDMYESIVSKSDLDVLINKSEDSNPILMKYYLKK